MPIQLHTNRGFPARHGVTLRTGGASAGPYASLNVGDAVGDDPSAVTRNRRRVAERLGASEARILTIRQVHGRQIVAADDVRRAAPDPVEADAIVSDDPRDVLAIGIADCRPVLFFDPTSGAAAAAHCGWRGTVVRLVEDVVAEMSERYGSAAPELHVAIGPGIAGPCYQVGTEVVAAFAEAGFPADVSTPDDEGRARLDLSRALAHSLACVGVLDEHVHRDDACTHCEPQRFFSYRRDGVTGRHWAVVRPGPTGTI